MGFALYRSILLMTLSGVLLLCCELAHDDIATRPDPADDHSTRLTNLPGQHTPRVRISAEPQPFLPPIDGPVPLRTESRLEWPDKPETLRPKLDDFIYCPSLDGSPGRAPSAAMEAHESVPGAWMITDWPYRLSPDFALLPLTPGPHPETADEANAQSAFVVDDSSLVEPFSIPHSASRFRIFSGTMARGLQTPQPGIPVPEPQSCAILLAILATLTFHLGTRRRRACSDRLGR